ncbi:hypothetical protein GCM10007860_33020 [Chitiniphilus shinanonensis]|uniref:Lipoprotein n=1 Tax=Chitiniphilus shinanonensis TaxID=553088 RepID=A0ABQ6BVY2_9NEIS|nr:DUF4810 domain-containing protein [Chitiniphilus shinanonensis]GLS06135.1 hypothetical protein GCM10007860_33020 [Chitiniphilus shinanonensis]
MNHNNIAVRGTLATLVAACTLLAGCATPPTTLYQWEGYQQQVYKYFQGQSTEEQIGTLEAAFQKIRAKGSMPPPGFHAHLGMLYASIGDEAQAVQQFQTEKALFPESQAYMDFLLKKQPQPARQGE